MNSKGVRTVVWVSVGTLALIGLMLVVTGAWAGPGRVNPAAPLAPAGVVSGTISYQGRLLEGGTPVKGSRVMTFSLYADATGGVPLWSQSGSITITDGLFDVELAANPGIFDGQALWLGVQAAGDATEMTPRQPLLPAPYALSLRPGAVISATWNNPILRVINTGDSHAIWGSNNANYPTLYGENMGVGPAVLGHSANGTGVSGQGTEGVRGAGLGITSTGVFGEGMTGVRGQSLDGTGVSGSSANSIGVYGESITGTAGFFTSTYGAGVWANGVNGHALVTNRPSLIQGPNPKQIAVLRWYDAIDAASPYVVSVPCDPMDIAFDGDHLWVHETCTGDLYKIRASDGTVVFTTSVGTHNTHGLAYDGFYIWAPTPAGYLIRVRTSDGATMNIPLPVAFTPSSVAFDGRYVWVAGSSPNHVVRIRAGDPGISNTYTLPGGVTPDQLAFDGTYMWVTYSNMLNPGGIVRMLASNPVVSNTFEIGPSGGLVNSLAFDGANIWVANAVSNTITCLRAADGALLHTVALGAQPVHLVFDGYYIWATAWPSTGSNGLFKIRVQDGALVGAYVTNSTPWGIAFDGAHIWVVTESGTLNKY